MDVTEESFYIILVKVKDLHVLSVCNIALSEIVMTRFSVSQCFSSVELIIIILYKQRKPKLNLDFLNPSLTFCPGSIFILCLQCMFEEKCCFDCCQIYFFSIVLVCSCTDSSTVKKQIVNLISKNYFLLHREVQ